MSESNPDANDIEPDDYEQKATELMEKAAEHREAAEQEQQEMLDAVAEGEDWNVEETEWVELGNVDLEVKTWIGGEVIEDVAQLEEMQGMDDPRAARKGLETNIRMLTEQTETVKHGGNVFSNDNTIQQFWQGYVDRFGDKGILRAIDAVTEPIETEEQRKQDVVESFPAKKRGGRDGSWNRGNRES
jgi:hypothetical protein